MPNKRTRIILRWVSETDLVLYMLFNFARLRKKYRCLVYDKANKLTLLMEGEQLIDCSIFFLIIKRHSASKQYQQWYMKISVW